MVILLRAVVWSDIKLFTMPEKLRQLEILIVLKFERVCKGLYGLYYRKPEKKVTLTLSSTSKFFKKLQKFSANPFELKNVRPSTYFKSLFLPFVNLFGSFCGVVNFHLCDKCGGKKTNSIFT